MPISNLFLSTYHKCMCMTNSSQAVRIQFQFIEVPYNLVELTAVGHRNGPKAGTIGFFCRPFLRLFFEGCNSNETTFFQSRLHERKQYSKRFWFQNVFEII